MIIYIYIYIYQGQLPGRVLRVPLQREDLVQGRKTPPTTSYALMLQHLATFCTHFLMKIH